MIRLWWATAIAVLSAFVLLGCSSRASTTQSGRPTQTGGVPSQTGGVPSQTGGAPSQTGGATHPGLSSTVTQDTGSQTAQPTDIDEKLNAYATECERSVGKFRSAMVDYPRNLSVDMDDSINYVAAVDIRATPAPPTQVIPSGNPTGEPVTVRCEVGARLSPVGSGIDVAQPDNAVDGWRYQQFTPFGLLKWAWTITGKAPGDHEVKLELRPAVKGLDVANVSATASVPYKTTVHVGADTVQKVSYWFQTDWPLLIPIVLAIGGAVLGVVKFGSQLRDELKKLFGRGPRGGRPTDPAQIGGAHPTPKPASARTPASRPRKKKTSSESDTGTTKRGSRRRT